MKVKSRLISTKELNGLNNCSQLQNAKRQLRKPIMNAFDIYKTNVHYGVIIETAEEHEAIINWYNDLCDLKESALNNIPNKIKKYM